MSDQQGYEIAIQRQVDSPLDVPELRMVEAVDRLLRTHDIAHGAGVSIVLADDDTVRGLNRQFRQIDAPTDVLSFPAESSGMPGEDDSHYLGDLLLALPYIQRQAEAEKHSLHDELILVVIHGTLHLLGYDHDTAEHQMAMWRVQAEALAVAGVDIVVPHFEFPDSPGDESA
jgi:probable rRNA maturation factor